MQNLKKKLKIGRLQRKIIATLAGWHFYGNPSKKLKIVGVTGTNGKTTTATLLYKVATELGYKAGLIGTVENIIAGEKIKHSETAPQTTPDPIRLNKLLKEMADRGCEYVFMEVSSHAMDQRRVAGVNFSGGIFTNLTHDHLDYHKNFENYFTAKKKFFQVLPKNAFALSNADDAYGEKILEGIKAKKYIYGFKTKADFNELLQSKLIGEFNMYNILAIYGASVLLGFDKEKVKEIIKNLKPVAGRFENIEGKNGVIGIVDYAHTPDALEKVLLAIQGFRKEGSKIILVFGCGGDRDPSKRSKMGKIGATLSDIAIFTSDNPRSEDADKIITEMISDLSPDDLKKVIPMADRHQAIADAVKLAKKGNIILLAGKGHETYQEIKGVKYPFDDMEELKKNFK
jgi:UDP-N-acetylmuramoyl-L-alanyl-D-glutamate--2,6-diaminopimelate ligase